MRHHLTGVTGEQDAGGGVVGGLGRVEVGRQRDLGVDDDVALAGEMDDEIGPEQVAVVTATARLLVEVDVGQQPRGLDEAAQLHLAPASAHLGAAQRGDEATGLVAQGVGAERREPDLLAELGVGGGPLALGAGQVVGDPGQGLVDRPDEGVDGRPLGRETGRGRGWAGAAQHHEHRSRAHRHTEQKAEHQRKKIAHARTLPTTTDTPGSGSRRPECA